MKLAVRLPAEVDVRRGGDNGPLHDSMAPQDAQGGTGEQFEARHGRHRVIVNRHGCPWVTERRADDRHYPGQGNTMASALLLFDLIEHVFTDSPFRPSP